MKERIVLAGFRSGVNMYHIAVGDEVKFFDGERNPKKLQDSVYKNADRLRFCNFSDLIIIIDDFTAPKWTVEDHLYFFLGEELYNEFWSECSYSDLFAYIYPISRIAFMKTWSDTNRGSLFWTNKSIEWEQYCKEMGLE